MLISAVYSLQKGCDILPDNKDSQKLSSLLIKPNESPVDLNKLDNPTSDEVLRNSLSIYPRIIRAQKNIEEFISKNAYNLSRPSYYEIQKNIEATISIFANTLSKQSFLDNIKNIAADISEFENTNKNISTHGIEKALLNPIYIKTQNKLLELIPELENLSINAPLESQEQFKTMVSKLSSTLSENSDQSLTIESEPYNIPAVAASKKTKQIITLKNLSATIKTLIELISFLFLFIPDKQLSGITEQNNERIEKNQELIEKNEILQEQNEKDMLQIEGLTDTIEILFDYVYVFKEELEELQTIIDSSTSGDDDAEIIDENSLTADGVDTETPDDNNDDSPNPTINETKID